jgi:hypothetical protein
MRDLHKNILEEQEKLNSIGIKENLYDLLAKNFESEKQDLTLDISIEAGSENLRKGNLLIQYEREEEDEFRLIRYEFSRLSENAKEMYVTDTNDFDRLDRIMQTVDWNNMTSDKFLELADDRLNAASSEEKKINEIINEIKSLHESPDSSDLANYLIAKYWLHTPIEQELLNTDDLKSRFEERLMIEAADGLVTIHEADLLLEGGAIYSPYLTNEEINSSGEPYWLTTNEEDRVEKISNVNYFDIRGELSILPLKETLGLISIDELTEKLQRGEGVHLTYYDGQDQDDVILHANPKKSSIDIEFVDTVRDFVDEVLDPEAAVSVDILSTENTSLTPEEIKELIGKVGSKGFSSEAIPGILDRIRHGKTEFNVNTWGKIDGIEYQALLTFKENKVHKPDLESFELTIESGQIKNPTFVQSFKASDALSLNLEQAFSLMQEKSIVVQLKGQDDQDVPTWMKMEFEKKLPDGNYPIMPITEQRLNVREELLKYDILNTQYQNVLNEMTRLLESGRELKVSMSDEFKKSQYSISASPTRNTFDIYNSARQLVPNINLVNRNSDVAKASNLSDDTDQEKIRRKK